MSQSPASLAVERYDAEGFPPAMRACVHGTLPLTEGSFVEVWELADGTWQACAIVKMIEIDCITCATRDDADAAALALANVMQACGVM